MLNTFSAVTPFLKFNPRRVTIDNLIFQLHYHWTFIILLIATILVTSRQYIGEHIKCITDSEPAHVINTFCFFTTTFTVVRHLNATAYNTGAVAQLGIGPMDGEDDPIKHHAYYQWVPFVLFAQAICFYLPHALWKSWEGGRVKALVFGLRMVGLSQYVKEQSLKIGQLNLPSCSEMEFRVQNIRRNMVDRMRLNQSWGAHLIFAELLNLVNILLQFYLTNRFLGGAFYDLGLRVLRDRNNSNVNTLEVVFPKITKCSFHKFGPSGSLQMKDSLCVMALNIINEKIYSVLWFWFVFLLIATVFGIIWRILTIFSYKSLTFSKYSLYFAKSGKIDEKELDDVIQKCNFSNWMFLYFLRCNLSEFLFKKVIFHLASEFPDPCADNIINARIDREQEPPGPSRTQTLKVDEVDSPLLHTKIA